VKRPPFFAVAEAHTFGFEVRYGLVDSIYPCPSVRHAGAVEAESVGVRPPVPREPHMRAGPRGTIFAVHGAGDSVSSFRGYAPGARRRLMPYARKFLDGARLHLSLHGPRATQLPKRLRDCRRGNICANRADLSCRRPDEMWAARQILIELCEVRSRVDAGKRRAARRRRDVEKDLAARICVGGGGTPEVTRPCSDDEAGVSLNNARCRARAPAFARVRGLADDLVFAALHDGRRSTLRFNGNPTPHNPPPPNHPMT